MRHIMLIAIVSSSCSPAIAMAKTHLFVSLKDDQKIAIYQLDEQAGRLTQIGETAIHGEPGGLTASPDRSQLFAAIRSRGELASYAIDPATGQLQHVNTVTAAADPAYLATDRTGKFLLSAYYVAGKVAVHEIRADGSIADEGVWYVTDDKAHAIAVDDQNRWVFVPHTGPNAIFQFELDPTTGRLKPNDPNKLTTPPNTGPRHLDFHRTAGFAYCDNEQGSSVTAFRFDRKTGQLKALQTWSTLPAEFEQPNSCARMEVSPDGRFLYAANRGHDSIAAFRIGPADGLLTRIGIFSTEPTPRSLHVDPSSRFLVAAGQDSDRLAVYRVLSTGTLDRIGTVPVGKTPWWVMFVQAGANGGS